MLENDKMCIKNKQKLINDSRFTQITLMHPVILYKFCFIYTVNKQRYQCTKINNNISYRNNCKLTITS